MKTNIFFLLTTFLTLLLTSCKPAGTPSSSRKKASTPALVGKISSQMEVGPKTSGTLSLSPQYYFSTYLPRLISKQGVSEARVTMSDADLDKRYNKMKSLGVSYRQYNLWWSMLENSGLNSSSSPISCPSGHILIPANETERIAMGYKKYRCINKNTLAVADDLLKRDRENDMQTGVILWSAPANYQYPTCEGFVFGGHLLKGGCVPRDDAMDDFEDFVNLVASRWNGNSRGKISHFIVWNENASTEWFDYTPIVSKANTSSTSFNRRIDKYADMMKRAHAALLRHQKQALLYASTDQLWLPGQRAGHMGTKVLLDGLWSRLGTAYSWSVAVHPYGDVDRPAGDGVYTFENLEMVTQYQASKLLSFGVANPYSYPQTLMIASEQGWPLPTLTGTNGVIGKENQARQICLAHEKAMSLPQLTVVSHNYFHSNEPSEMDPNGKSVQEGFFGLLPNSIPDSLEGMESTSTGKAFISTLNPSLWKKRDNHFCCKIYKLGCSSGNNNNAPSVQDAHPVLGYIDEVSMEEKTPLITGWACTRGMDASISVHLFVDGPSGSGKFVGSYYANRNSEPSIAESCGTDGVAYRFEIPITSGLASLYSGKPIYIHGISKLGFANNLLNNSGKVFFPGSPKANLATSKSSEKVPIYRFYKNGDHMMSANPKEGEAAQYANEGFKFYMFKNPVHAGYVAIYRCYTYNNHFFSQASNCEGTNIDGLIGYLLTSPTEDSKPVYRFFSPALGKHLITTDYDEGINNGFIMEGILGHAL